VTGATSPRALTGLTASTTYYYQVTAKTGASSASSTGSFTTLVAPPGVPVLGAVTPAQTSASIPWSAGAGGAVASYSLKYGTSSTLVGATTVATVTSPYSLTGLTAGTLYYYQVIANNSTASAPSSIGNFTTTALSVTAPVVVLVGKTEMVPLLS
jgi:phosphodiesterase/alkaline phosphatase D-like protein